MLDFDRRCNFIPIVVMGAVILVEAAKGDLGDIFTVINKEPDIPVEHHLPISPYSGYIVAGTTSTATSYTVTTSGDATDIAPHKMHRWAVE